MAEPKREDWGQAFESLAVALDRLVVAGHDVMRCKRATQHVEGMNDVAIDPGHEQARMAESQIKKAVEACTIAIYSINASYEQVFNGGLVINEAGTHVVAE